MRSRRSSGQPSLSILLAARSPRNASERLAAVFLTSAASASITSVPGAARLGQADADEHHPRRDDEEQIARLFDGLIFDEADIAQVL